MWKTLFTGFNSCTSFIVSEAAQVTLFSGTTNENKIHSLSDKAFNLTVVKWTSFSINVGLPSS